LRPRSRRCAVSAMVVRKSFGSKGSRFLAVRKRLLATSTHSITRSEMAESPTDEQNYKMIEEAILSLAAEGLLYDTGERRWSNRTQSYQVVWAAVPRKGERH
jgi:hypothetical protein